LFKILAQYFRLSSKDRHIIIIIIMVCCYYFDGGCGGGGHFLLEFDSTGFAQRRVQAFVFERSLRKKLKKLEKTEFDSSRERESERERERIRTICADVIEYQKRKERESCKGKRAREKYRSQS
jgi:hypothetical protein